ncbi:MAG: glycosyltransferase [Desulfatitalea sp.]|nr:glycosyltransferase [Desulfatitalea sp.]
MLISIIIPVYNAEKYLERCIESAIHQIYKQIEIILVNDGSTDSSEQICNKYAGIDQRVKVITQENSGPSAARNNGMKNAIGQFLFFIDADDYIEHDAISLLAQCYRRTKADMIIGDFNKILNNQRSGSGDDGVFTKNKRLTKQDIIEYNRKYLKRPNKYQLLTFAWARLYRAAIIRDNNIYFNTDLFTFEDVAFNIDYMSFGNGVFYLRKAIYNHLIYDDDMSVAMTIRKNPSRLLGYKTALVNISNFFNKYGATAEIKAEIGHAYITLTISQLVRVCGQIDDYRRVHAFTNEVIDDPLLKKNFQFYSPVKGNSRIIPILMRLKLVWLTILVCKYKAHKRYKYKQ